METQTHPQDRKRLRTSAWPSQPQKETAFSIPSDLTSSSRRFRSGPSPTTVNRAKSLRKRGAAARKARSQAFRGTRPPTKISSSLAPGSGLRESRNTKSADAGLRDKKQLVAICGKLGIGLGRSGNDRSRVAISGAGKRQKPIRFRRPEIHSFWFSSWPKPGGQGKPPLSGPSTKGIGPLRRKKAKGLGKRRHRQDAQNDIKLTRKDAAPQLPPGAPFKSKRKGIAMRSTPECHSLFEDLRKDQSKMRSSNGIRTTSME